MPPNIKFGRNMVVLGRFLLKSPVMIRDRYFFNAFLNSHLE